MKKLLLVLSTVLFLSFGTAFADTISTKGPMMLAYHDGYDGRYNRCKRWCYHRCAGARHFKKCVKHCIRNRCGW